MVIQSKCGIVVARTLHDAHAMISQLVHRGPDMTGIAAIGNTIDVVKWLGKPKIFEITDLEAIFPGHHYHTYLAHVRYKTDGGDELSNAHPQVIGGKKHNNGSHIIYRDCDAVIVHNGQVNKTYMKDVPKELLTTACDSEQLLHYILKHGPNTTLKNIPAAYTLAYATKKNPNVTVLRDQTGIRPGWLFFKDGKYGMVSEDIAAVTNGGEAITELGRGSRTTFHPNGEYTTHQITPSKDAFCFFEHGYLADRNSHYTGLSVLQMRRRLGKYLAHQMQKENLILPDAIVTYVPRCAKPMAQKLAAETQLAFHQVFYKMRSDRSFQESTQEKRDKSISSNLHILPEWQDKLEGKKIILVDDSIVRGTNVKRPRDLLIQAGVKKEDIILALAMPPIGIQDEKGCNRGCFWGVDMPPTQNFIARNRTLEEIQEMIGIKVVYLTPENLYQAYESWGLDRKRLCSYCIGGKAPHSMNHTT